MRGSGESKMTSLDKVNTTKLQSLEVLGAINNVNHLIQYHGIAKGMTYS